MVGFGLQANNAERATVCLETTKQQMETIHAAIDAYVSTHNRYPLPASRMLGIQDPDFGREVNASNHPGIKRVVGSPPVLIGTLPTTTLGMPNEIAADCWRNAFTYAVTETLTTEAGYALPTNLGGISLKRGTLAVPVVISTQIAYVAISHGSDSMGAVPERDIGAVQDCNPQQADATIRRIDKENCDTVNNSYFASDYSEGDNANNFFDDFVTYAEKPPLASGDCASETITWGGGCEAPALITLGGLQVPLTNIASGYTGTAVSVCNNGVRTTILGVCLPVGICSGTNPRTGNPMSLLTGLGANFGAGICQQYRCCNGAITTKPLSPCPLLDLPGLAVTCS